LFSSIAQADGKWTGTQAAFINWFNTQHGVIISTTNFGPADASKPANRPPDAVANPAVPEIKTWADIVWVEWRSQCEQNPTCIRGIKYFVRFNIINQDWKDIARRRYGTAGLPLWNGARNQKMGFDRQWASQFVASPNGRGPAWFLISTWHPTAL
jgi:hypothetical protein